MLQIFPAKSACIKQFFCIFGASLVLKAYGRHIGKCFSISDADKITTTSTEVRSTENALPLVAYPLIRYTPWVSCGNVYLYCKVCGEPVNERNR